MRLGFSYVGLIMLIMLFVPNIMWMENQPKDYDKYVGNENRLLLGLERVGEVAVSALCLIFADFNIRAAGLWCLWLAGAGVLMVMYELYWLRYFRSEKTMADFYSSFCGVPIAGATLPVAAFMMLAVYGKNVPLGIASVVLGIGHIGIHLAHKKEIAK